MRTLILTGGGTAGHVTPNLALLPFLKKRFDKIVYVGSYDGVEKSLAKRENLPYYPITTVKLERKFTPKNLLIPIKLVKGIQDAKKIIKDLKPSAIFSKGGYVSLPTVIAGKKLKVPVISHESDMTVGLANKIGAKYSDLFLTSFDCTKVSDTKTVFTGSPINEKLFFSYDKNALLKKYGLSGRKKILLVFGGSLGSLSINKMVEKCLYKLINRYDVIHLCGRGKGENSREKGYLKMQFSDSIGELFFLSDLIVSRAGANSLFELTALKKPTLAIPLPKGNSRGDQIENAEYFKKRKLIEVLYEEDMTEKTFYSAIVKLETNAKSLTHNCAKHFSKLPNEKIAKLITSVSLQD
ncbi:MAG: UDP-N-acetylglucosamine--N-acetylmuramyl-(pentapeptide) pyrophosphoryl-undecaprenol N-acetylglucosamine transferase [Clostridia bacterium]|nr:UDP-N-acetylglucosamine--N-acetylmuramyl-(pentapeptide) pyrophosphoryl-undecaprenol N-acetylglucosamine transferase [Clostridia bacterium]